MNTFLKVIILSLSLFLFSRTASNARAGFSLADSLTEFTLTYKTADNLIILPVIVNDSITVNLILDTGCRNLVLFGKRFQAMFNYDHGRPIQFAGMGAGKPAAGMLSLNNSVSIGKVLGEGIPIVVVPEKNFTAKFHQVHGIIGYEIFSRFEIQINPLKQSITFRSSLNNYVPEGFTKIPIKISDSKPLINSTIHIANETLLQDLLLDTGSSLELLIKSTEIKTFNALKKQYTLGRGLNGTVNGLLTIADDLSMGDYNIKNLNAGIIHSSQHNYASIGMGALKDYVIIINYSQSYTCLKKIA